MNNEDLQVQFKVIGIFGAPSHTFTLGTYDCIRDAQKMVDTWPDDPQFKYTQFVEMKIVKHSQVTVQTSKGLGEVNNNLPASSSLSPPAAADTASAVDYERQGVPPSTGRFEGIRGGDTTGVESAKELKELRDLLHHLEDRHVGLRHELLTDFEALQDDVEELRDDAASAAAEIDNLDGAMRHEVAGLRREMESLRAELRQTAGNAGNNHEQWRRQQVLDRMASER